MFWVSSRQEEATQILLRKYDESRNNIYGEENIVADLVRPSLTSRQKGRVCIWCGIKLRGLESVQMDNNNAGSSHWWRDGLITYRYSQCTAPCTEKVKHTEEHKRQRSHRTSYDGHCCCCLSFWSILHFLNALSQHNCCSWKLFG